MFYYNILSKTSKSSIPEAIKRLKSSGTQIHQKGWMDDTEEHVPWLDNLSIQQFIGSGPRGYVFRTRNKLDSSYSALRLKFETYLRYPNSNDKKAKDHVKNLFGEINFIRGRQHPNILQIFNFTRKFLKYEEIEDLSADIFDETFQDRIAFYASQARRLGSLSVIYINMELCGKTLRQWLNKDHQSSRALNNLQVGIVQGLIEGLKFLHSLDLKIRCFQPKFIMFSRGYLLPIKIEGFSVFKTNKETDSDYSYAAPEYKVPASEEHSQKSDLYSLGVIIWEVLQPSDRARELLHKLVYDKDYSVIKEHPSIQNSRELIIGLTQRKAKDRIPDINSVLLDIKAEDITENSWLDSYNVQRFLGSGGFGFALVARNKVSLAYSAIKISFPGFLEDTERIAYERKCTLREFHTIVGKSHKNVMQIYELALMSFTPQDIDQLIEDVDNYEFQDRIAIHANRAKRYGSIEGVCIRMELCGNSLRQWLNLDHPDQLSKELCEFQVDIVKGLVEGLTFLHSNQLIHRDLKPDNIMFSSDYKLPIKIGDFGLCRRLHSDLNSMTGKLTKSVGTADYMANEMDYDTYGMQADLYSLGLIVWEVLQLIKNSERKQFFDRLVYDKEHELVKDHPGILNSKELIINLTNRDVKERLGDINLVVV